MNNYSDYDIDNEDPSWNQFDRLATPDGTILVTVQGDKLRPAIITVHDLGMNASSTFRRFIHLYDVKRLMEKFCLYHITVPGHELGATAITPSTRFPSMDTMAHMLVHVVEFYGLEHFIGLGVGAGTNILLRYGVQYPEILLGLFLINPIWRTASAKALLHNCSFGAHKFLMFHYFGRTGKTSKNRHLWTWYNMSLATRHTQSNAGLFIESFLKRHPIRLNGPSDQPALKCRVMLIAGKNSPYFEEMLGLNEHLMLDRCEMMSLFNVSMPLEEEAFSVFEALHLYLQGLGFASSLIRQTCSAIATPGIVVSKLFQKAVSDEELPKVTPSVEAPLKKFTPWTPKKLAAETSGQRSKLWIFHKEETIPVQHRRRQKVLEEGTQESEMLLT